MRRRCKPRGLSQLRSGNTRSPLASASPGTAPERSHRASWEEGRLRLPFLCCAKSTIDPFPASPDRPCMSQRKMPSRPAMKSWLMWTVTTPVHSCASSGSEREQAGDHDECAQQKLLHNSPCVLGSCHLRFDPRALLPLLSATRRKSASHQAHLPAAKGVCSVNSSRCLLGKLSSVRLGDWIRPHSEWVRERCQLNVKRCRNCDSRKRVSQSHAEQHCNVVRIRNGMGHGRAVALLPCRKIRTRETLDRSGPLMSVFPHSGSIGLNPAPWDYESASPQNSLFCRGRYSQPEACLRRLS